MRLTSTPYEMDIQNKLKARKNRKLNVKVEPSPSFVKWGKMVSCKEKCKVESITLQVLLKL